MSEVNFEDTIINITLGDIVQQFTESELQKQMPIFMQDIDAETKELVDTYQSYISAGNFSEAEAYRAANPALETRIWDAFKANSLLAYVAYVYLYAQNQHQQCYFSDTEPSLFNETTGIGAVDGDIWFKYTTKTETSEEGTETISIDYSVPFNTYVLKDGVWEKFTVTPELDVASESDIDEVYNPETEELTNPESLINETGLKYYTNKLNTEMNEKFTNLNEQVQSCFQSASDGKQAIIDAITGSGGAEFTLNNSWQELADYITKNFLFVTGSTMLYPNSELVGWNGDQYIGYSDYFDITKINSLVITATAYAANGYTNNLNRFWSYGGRAVITVLYEDETSDIGTVTFNNGTNSASGGTSQEIFTFDTSEKTGKCMIQVQSWYKHNTKWEDGSSGPWTEGKDTHGYGYINSAIAYV